MNGMFRDRTEAGRVLAPKLRRFANRPDVVVLALPRGGVPVGCEIACKLHAPLDILIVRKLGVPGQEELAMGAIASGGVEFRDSSIITALNISAADVAAVVARERIELGHRERLYRKGLPACDMKDKTVLLVDDGMATGSTMRAAVRAVASTRPQSIVVAVPVASAEAVDILRGETASVVTVLTTARLFAIGDYYRDFSQVKDDEVRALLAKSRLHDGRAGHRLTTRWQKPEKAQAPAFSFLIRESRPMIFRRGK